MKNMLFIFIYCVSIVSTTAQMNKKHTLEHNNVTRKYTVFLPSNYDTTKTYPLVINMHGMSGDVSSHMFYSHFSIIADTADIIVVYPQGLVGTTTWGATETQWDAYFGTGTKDLEFLDTLIDQMYYDYPIDLTRVYSTGHSNGGFMSYRLACELSERIAAIASVCGAMAFQQENNCNISHPMPILQLHGTADVTVPFTGQPLLHSSIPDLMDFWKNKNNCTADSTITDIPNINVGDSCSASISDYSICDNPAQVQLYTITNGGHSWPGAFDYPSLGNTCQDFNASSVIWNFFNQYQLSNPTIPEELTKIPENFNSTFTIKPNPFTESFSIDFNSNEVENITILNVLGENIFETTNTNGNSLTFNGGELDKGIYLVLANGVVVSKIIKD